MVIGTSLGRRRGAWLEFWEAPSMPRAAAAAAAATAAPPAFGDTAGAVAVCARVSTDTQAAFFHGLAVVRVGRVDGKVGAAAGARAVPVPIAAAVARALPRVVAKVRGKLTKLARLCWVSEAVGER